MIYRVDMKTDMPDIKQGEVKIENRREPSKQGSRSRVCQEHDEQDCLSENEHEFESLEYEEDVYYSNLTATPSFDDIDELSDDVDEIVVHCWRDSNGDIDEIVVDDANLSVETQFLTNDAEDGATNRDQKKKKKSVRVIFQDFSKPYLAKISNSQNYKKFLELVKGAAYNFCDKSLISLTRSNYCRFYRLLIKQYFCFTFSKSFFFCIN